MRHFGEDAETVTRRLELFLEGGNIIADGLEALGAVAVRVEPVVNVLRQGWQTAMVTWLCSKRMPSRSSLSMFGVRLGILPPKQLGVFQFMSSTVRRRRRGRHGGTGGMIGK